MFSAIYRQLAITSNANIVSSSLNFLKFRKYSSNNKNIIDFNASDKNDTIINEKHNSTEGDELNVSQLLQDSTTYDEIENTDWATTPYPEGSPIPSDKQKEPIRNNPTDYSVLMFPGQGTLKVGSIKNYLHFPAVKELFEIANEILRYNLLELCLRGPQEKLDKTLYNQPATVISSLAALEKIREERPRVFDTCVSAAGYSVGEITALIFSGAMTVEEGMRLVAVRAAAMQEASQTVPQGMLSVNCDPTAKISNICKEAKSWAQDLGVENPICQIAIYLYTQSKILAGNEEALKYIENNSKKLGLSKVQRLPVSGAFHTPLMVPALEPFHKILKIIDFQQPRIYVYSNLNANVYRNEKFIKQNLLKQIIAPVKWEQCMQKMFNRPEGTTYPKIYDVGSGGRMKLILKLINAKAYNTCFSV